MSFADKVSEPCSKAKVISIIGPTASGKTSLAIHLALELEKRTGKSCQIVNADAYQMYKHMDIGTAKASRDEQTAVKHHLLDIIEPSEEMSVAKFQKLARHTIKDLQSKGIRPILVGGSGLYARAAIDDITFPGTDPQIRARIEERAERIGAQELFKELEAKDPVAASRMDARNIRRTVRALEVIELTGKLFSASLPQYKYVIETVQIGLDLPREDLDHRIDLRTQIMRKEGLEEEVRQLRDQLSITAARALGYEQMINVLDGRMTADEAFEDIAQKTKRLARKQMGWFGRDPRVHWLNALDDNLVNHAADIVIDADNGVFDAFDAAADDYVHHHLGNVETL